MNHPTKTDLGAAPDRPLPADADLTGRLVADYQILRRLGQGGMGHVYLAQQISLHRKVALKILRSDFVANHTYLERFKAEARAVGKATHANIVQVYGAGEDQGIHYMALEYIEGRNLRDYLSKKGPPDLALALSIIRQVAGALQRAGELGIIHRDIKPENILLTRKGEVKVADFGLSRVTEGDQPLNLTQTGVTMGTPLYMSPEQVQGHVVDPRTDMYSLGVTCYHMLAGQPPFRGETAFQVALQHVQSDPIPLNTIRPDLPAELSALVHKMMAKKPEDRYQTPREMLRDLARLREGMATPLINSAVAVTPSLPAAAVPIDVSTTVPTQPGIPLSLPRSRRWLRVALAALLLTAFAGLGIGSALLLRHRGGAEVPASSVPDETASTGGSEQAVEESLSPRKREEFLKQAVEQYLHPGNDAARTRLGMGNCLELGLFYLEQRRLDEADQFFVRLETLTPPVLPYRYFGQLGHAIVLAFKDQAETSIALFQVHLPIRPIDRRGLDFLQQNPRLREMIGLALEQDRLNLKPEQKFPRELEPFRKPPGLPKLPAGPGQPKKP